MGVKLEIKPGQFILIDESDIPLLDGHRWHIDDKGYPRTRDGIKVHRLLMNPPEGMWVDHINGDPADNRRCNLRVCTSQQNGMNKRPRKGFKYKGVTYQPKRKKWYASIGYNYKRYYLGRFNTEKEAAMAYNKAALKYHGEYAHLNSVGAV